MGKKCVEVSLTKGFRLYLTDTSTKEEELENEGSNEMIPVV